VHVQLARACPHRPRLHPLLPSQSRHELDPEALDLAADGAFPIDLVHIAHATPDRGSPVQAAPAEESLDELGPIGIIRMKGGHDQPDRRSGKQQRPERLQPPVV
jgi:hypothetical protein